MYRNWHLDSVTKLLGGSYAHIIIYIHKTIVTIYINPSSRFGLLRPHIMVLVYTKTIIWVDLNDIVYTQIRCSDKCLPHLTQFFYFNEIFNEILSNEMIIIKISWFHDTCGLSECQPIWRQTINWTNIDPIHSAIYAALEKLWVMKLWSWKLKVINIIVSVLWYTRGSFTNMG